MTKLIAKPLTQQAFRPFGDVIEVADHPFKLINDGMCRRYHDLARLQIMEGSPGISLFQAEIRALPYRFDLLERHPLGSQCFLPTNGSDYLVIVAEDSGGQPGSPQAFMAHAAQGVNYHRNVWHGVLAPVSPGGAFVVVDRIGTGVNLEEYRLAAPFEVSLE